MKRKLIIRRMLAAVMTLVMVLTLFPVSTLAYVGAMSRNEGAITSGSQDGYLYLQNSYIGFYIRPDGSLTTVPSQKGLSDVKAMGATEIHAFYGQVHTMEEINPVKTDMSRELLPNSRSAKVVSNGENPKLLQTFTFSNGAKIDITYELVRLDNGAATNITPQIIEHDGSDGGKTWGVYAEAKISNAPADTSIRWTTRHVRFGGVGHNITGNVRQSRSNYIYDNRDMTTSQNHYSAPLYSTSGLMDTVSYRYNITEVFTDSFSYANQFIALEGYASALGYSSDGLGGWVPELITGVRGHLNGYGVSFSYSSQNNSTFSVNHDFLHGEDLTWSLWGFRNLYETGATNIPSDPVSIPADAACLGIVKNGSFYSAQPAQNENELQSRYGSNLVTVFRGVFKQESGNYIFQNGAVQLSPSLTATWTEGLGRFTVSANGIVSTQNVHLSCPTFKFYKPISSADNSLIFSYNDGKLKVGMIPANNVAILHIDIPGAKCVVETVTSTMDGAIVFTGEMDISTPFIDAASLEMNKLGMGRKNNVFGVIGVDASGAIDMKKLMGLDVGSASAEINTFPGEERYAFQLELNVFEMFEAEGELELKRIYTGALIPNTLKIRGASEVGVPLVPPVVVAEFNGLSGGFSNLANTINGDYSAIPPLRLTVGAKGSVLEVFEGWYDITVGAGYYQARMSDGTILKFPIVNEYSWYVGLQGDVRKYKGIDYTGLMVNGGMKLDLSITNELPFIKAGGSLNASAFAGVGNSGANKRMYVMLGADGKIYGLVQIPDEAWAFGDFVLASAEVDLALGGQTDFDITNTSVSDAAKSAFRNISGYGGVAYTGSIIGLPFRIYYIFQDKNVGVKVGFWGDKFEPFNPSPFRQALLDETTGEQIGILVANDNIILLASSTWDENLSMVSERSVSTTPSGIMGSVISSNVVTITQTDDIEKSYEVVFADDAYDPKYMAFSLKLKEYANITPQQLLSGINITNSGSTTFSAILTEYDEKGEITNPDEANTVLGNDYVTLKLPSKGVWNFVSSTEPFDIACYYSTPYASLTDMNISTDVLSGVVQYKNSSSKYILRTYLGNEKGGTDFLISQDEVPLDGIISKTLSLSGGAVSTGSYYLTTILLEQIKEDFDGDGIIEDDEIAFIRNDEYNFDEGQKVTYTNNIKPNYPEEVQLESTGSENMRALWKSPLGVSQVDGYFIKLYQKNGEDWISTGANYLVKQNDLKTNIDGKYFLDMAVTSGNKNENISPLKPDESYRIGITAFSYLADEDSDGKNDTFPVESEETKSSGQYLPKASYPQLTYDPQIENDGKNGMKVLNINENTRVTVKSDVKAKIIVTRMDIDENLVESVVAESYDANDFELGFYTPEDFDGALNLKITAIDAEGDITVDYLGLRLDDVPPVLSLDSYLFLADFNTGCFNITGVTESNANVMMVNAMVTEQGLNGVEFNNLDENFQVTADEKGVFTMNGKLILEDSSNSADKGSATILLQSEDGAGNKSLITIAQIIHGQQSSGASSSSSTHYRLKALQISIAPENKPGQPLTAVISVTENGKVDDAVIAEAINKAKAYAKENGKTNKSISLVIDVISMQSDSFDITLGRDALKSLVNEGIENFEINGATISFGLNFEALKQILEQSEGDVSIKITPAKNLSHNAKKYIGERPAYNVTVSYVSKDKTVYISDLGGGTATISIYYIPGNKEALCYLSSIYVDDKGDVSFIPGFVYNSQIRRFIVTTDHLSVYGVGYTEPSAKFTDIVNHWSKDYIDYVVGCGLLTGTSETTFSPDTAMTRGMLVTVLGRMSGVDSKWYTKSSFTDVSVDKYYYTYVEWAYKNSIVKGIGNKEFAPDRAVTREEMAIIFENYAKATGYILPIIYESNAYKDYSNIQDAYKKAIEAMQKAGIMMGDSENKFNPQSSSTRGEIAVMLQRYINLDIDPATAQGWSINNLGEHRYYLEGKVLYGWQEIDGEKYFFNDDGTLKTGWVKDGDNWRYYLGNELFKGWREIEGKNYYFNDDGYLAKSTTIDGYQVDENGTLY